MEYRVSYVNQRASSGSYLVKYHAEVEAIPGDGVVTVEVVSTVPEDADPDLLRESVKSIRRGAESVVRSRGLGVRLRVHRLCIHDVDCRPPLYETATVEALARVLDAGA